MLGRELRENDLNSVLRDGLTGRKKENSMIKSGGRGILPEKTASSKILTQALYAHMNNNLKKLLIKKKRKTLAHTPMLMQHYSYQPSHGKQSRCSTIDAWIISWCIYTIKHYLNIRKNEIMSFAGKWVELESVMLSQAQKNKGCIFSLICGRQALRSS
jgi:hypothetical protein